jgi:hypothetical protein
MTQNHSRARQEAEAAFARVQSVFLARDGAGRPLDAMAEARRAHSLALRDARLAREQEGRALADGRRAASPSKSRRA